MESQHDGSFLHEHMAVTAYNEGRWGKLGPCRVQYLEFLQSLCRIDVGERGKLKMRAGGQSYMGRWGIL